MKKRYGNLLILALLIAGLIYGPASAISIQFTDRGLAGPSDLDVYYVNGTYIDKINTTSQIDVEDSVIIHVSPNRSKDYIDDPMTFVDDASDFVRDNLLALIIIVLILVMVVNRR